MEESNVGLGLFFSGFASEPCVIKSIEDDLGREEGFLGVDQVENSLVDHSTMKVEDDGLNCSSVEDGIKTTGGSIAERRAAKLGFNVDKISSPRFRSSAMLPSSPGVRIRSPYLTIPPGISPTALLNSPIMISNLQPSPTTGAAVRPHVGEGNEMLISASQGEMDKGSLYSMFKPREDPNPLSCAMVVENQGCSTSSLGQSSVAHLEYQSLTSMNMPMDIELPMHLPQEVAVDNDCPGMPPGRKNRRNLTVNDKSNTLHSAHLNVVQMEDKNEALIAPISTLKTAEDGYCWRKYGQKQVKGSEYPRSYYKCSHQNCEVKKKVEHSHDGQIVEIIYKGSHNHPKPQTSWKSTSSLSETSDANDAIRRDVNVEGILDCRNDGNLERTSSTSAVTEVSDLLSTTHGKLRAVPESAGTPEFSSTMAVASHEDVGEDEATQGSFSHEDDCDNEPDSKRRRKEMCSIETTLSSRPAREPRVVVQIESDVDILDDGYRWRKYGQKVVKGNPNPRSYYKCTNAGCTVRKHVERASHNLKCVITTYEGKHNHEVPPAKNGSHANSGGVSLPPFGTMNNQSSQPHLEGTMECNSEFLRPDFLASIPFYHQMKFPTLYNAMPYDHPFGPGNHHHPAHSHPSSIVRPISLPLGFARPPIPSISNYGNPGMLPSSVQQPLFALNQLKENNVKLHPKEEQRDSLMYDTSMENSQNTDHANS